MAKKKKRKLRIGRLIFLIVLLSLILSGLIYALYKIENRNEVFDKELTVNEIDYSEMKELDLDLYSKSYMLVRLNDFKVLYGKNIFEKFYPASLTKVVTLDTVVKNVDNLNDYSYISNNDYARLIEANASLAGIKVNYDYTLKDLLYALVLPSGGDAGLALENYFSSQGKDLISLMNSNLSSLGIKDSHFTNTTGLHDESLYTTLDDYARVVIDTLNNADAKEILKSYRYTLDDGITVRSTLRSLENYFDEITIYGGKTGFTGEAGENLMVLYSTGGRSYLLILASAPGNPYVANENYHFIDAVSVLEYLYK